MSDKVLRLSDIDPQLATELKADETVVVFGPEICGYCSTTLRLLDKGGVRAIKHTVDDSDHPVIVAAKAHLGAKGSVASPFVFKFDVFSWTGMDGSAIRETIAEKKAELAASVA